MKTILILGALFAVASATYSPRLLHQHWSSFKVNHQKQYASVEEESKRLAIFKDNLAKIEAHNALYDTGKATYTMAINQFADITGEEFIAYVNRTIVPELPGPRETFVATVSAKATSLDWRNQGIVTPVKNQGQCGSCWSFSATGALEGQYGLRNGRLISLSEQQLVDCASAYGNAGCNGGWMDSAFQYVRDNGITTEDSYPYEARQGSCRWNGQTVLRVTGFKDVSPSVSNVKAAVEQLGPLSVAIDATNNLQFYSSGIFNDNSCSSTQLNHGVLVVGFGSNYWLVKNSWGSSWGESGYVRFSNSGTACGLTTAASAPTLG